MLVLNSDFLLCIFNFVNCIAFFSFLADYSCRLIVLLLTLAQGSGPLGPRHHISNKLVHEHESYCSEDSINQPK